MYVCMGVVGIQWAYLVEAYQSFEYREGSCFTQFRLLMLFWSSAKLLYVCAHQVDMLPVLDFSDTWLDGTSCA